MTAPPLVSVIVPAFNAERFIVRTLKSAQAQTLRNIEFIVVDDGSTDATATLAMGLAETDRRIHVIRSVNQGVAAARNLGLKAATGTYVAFLDADDLWHSEKVLRQVEAFRRFDRDHTAIGAVYALCRPVDDHDRVIGSWEHCEIEGWVYLRHLLLNFVGNGSSLMCPTAVAREVGGFDSGLAAAGVGGCEDFDFQLRIAKRYRFVVVPEYLVGYRQHAAGMSRDRLRMVASRRAIVARQLAESPSMPKRCRRMAWGTVHAMTCRAAAGAGDFRRALAAAVALLSSDPVRFTYEATWRVPMMMAMDVRCRLGFAATSHANVGAPFYDVPTTETHPSTHNWLIGRRFRALRREEEARGLEIEKAEGES